MPNSESKNPVIRVRQKTYIKLLRREKACIKCRSMADVVEHLLREANGQVPHKAKKEKRRSRATCEEAD